jgi:hypothetical protein
MSVSALNKRSSKKFFQRDFKVKNIFRSYNNCSKFALLGLLGLTGCSGQEVYVYEKLPEVSECRRYKDYWTVSACNHKHQIILSEKLNAAIQTTNYRLRRKFNQGKRRCKATAYRGAPDGCYINHLPIRGNLPTVGKTTD